MIFTLMVVLVMQAAAGVVRPGAGAPKPVRIPTAGQSLAAKRHPGLARGAALRPAAPAPKGKTPKAPASILPLSKEAAPAVPSFPTSPKAMEAFASGAAFDGGDMKDDDAKTPDSDLPLLPMLPPASNDNNQIPPPPPDAAEPAPFEEEPEAPLPKDQEKWLRIMRYSLGLGDKSWPVPGRAFAAKAEDQKYWDQAVKKGWFLRLKEPNPFRIHISLMPHPTPSIKLLRETEYAQANLMIAKAARQYNEGGSGLATAYQALSTIEAIDDNLHRAIGPSRVIAGNLFKNAAISDLTEALRAYRLRLAADPSSWQAKTDAPRIGVALAYLTKAYFGAGLDPAPLDFRAMTAIEFLVPSMVGKEIPETDAAAMQRFVKMLDASRSVEAKGEAPPSQRSVHPDHEFHRRYGLDDVAKLSPNIMRFTRNLSLEAASGKIEPVVGREKEIDRVIRRLGRKTKPNPAIIGEAGVGKTAIVEGLAQGIVEGRYPTLTGRTVLQLDLAAMVAGTKYRGEFEERMKGVLKEAERIQDRIIIFVDEMHTILGAGGAEGALDMSNIIKPHLARGGVPWVGATTLDEFRKIESDPALARRFGPVMIGAPSAESTLLILEKLTPGWEDHHKIAVLPEALEAAVSLTDRFLKSRVFPDKAIDAVDEAASLARSEGASVVAAAHVEKVIGEWTGIPVKSLSADDKKALLELAGRINKKLVNQAHAVEAVTGPIMRRRAQRLAAAKIKAKEEKGPMGSFIFLGPTGVGKTELARLLAELYFQDPKALIEIDGADYMEKHNASRLAGAPPGYVGYEEGGQLTEKVRRRPYSVILFDEVEKAHEDAFNMLLQIMEEGKLTDSQGRVVDFRNTILIMTSNLGSSLVESQQGTLGFQKMEAQPERSHAIDALENHFRPEFLNRVDEVVTFNALEREHMPAVLDIHLANLNERMAVQAELTDAAKALVIDKGFNPAFGARPMIRALEKLIEDPISRKLLADELAPEGKVLVDAKDGKLTFTKKK